ncbi:MAG: hypothetical protein CVT49_06060 [candidate division Zixibacteria bacterium HGW-Zixibacteria-1]|nr:MAG: hypothetical protein CVT49_06060 [candidate division Zixibacteria bacterium HGW-Zixibacteria-1]
MTDFADNVSSIGWPRQIYLGRGFKKHPQTSLGMPPARNYTLLGADYSLPGNEHSNILKTQKQSQFLVSERKH